MCIKATEAVKQPLTSGIKSDSDFKMVLENFHKYSTKLKQTKKKNLHYQRSGDQVKISSTPVREPNWDLCFITKNMYLYSFFIVMYKVLKCLLLNAIMLFDLSTFFFKPD